MQGLKAGEDISGKIMLRVIQPIISIKFPAKLVQGKQRNNLKQSFIMVLKTSAAGSPGKQVTDLYFPNKLNDEVAFLHIHFIHVSLDFRFDQTQVNCRLLHFFQTARNRQVNKKCLKKMKAKYG